MTAALVSCRLCHRTTCFHHHLSAYVHSVEPLLIYGEGRDVDAWHQWHTQARPRFRSAHAPGSEDTYDMLFRLLRAAQTYTTCVPADSTRTKLGWYDQGYLVRTLCCSWRDPIELSVLARMQILWLRSQFHPLRSLSRGPPLKNGVHYSLTSPLIRPNNRRSHAEPTQKVLCKPPYHSFQIPIRRHRSHLRRGNLNNQNQHTTLLPPYMPHLLPNLRTPELIPTIVPRPPSQMNQ